MNNGDILRNHADQIGIPPRNIDQIKAALAQARKNKCEFELARLMQRYGRMTDEARGYLDCLFPRES